MYAAVLMLSAATTAGTTGLPYFSSGVLVTLPILGGLPIQTFGVIVAAGVLIGASILRRFGEWHGVGDDHIRGLTGWITVTGFIGAHLFDVIAYQWHEVQQDPILLIKVWAGISSYGGFIGGAAGFAFYAWWKRLPPRLMADMCIVGLLPAFSIGRIGCTVVSDHIGAAVDPSKWYSFLAMDYPRVGEAVHNSGIAHLVATNPGTSEFIRAWNLGLIEFLYLIPVNALVLFLAFRPAKPTGTEGFLSRTPAGFIAVLTGILYAPVRFFLDFLRPENSDPRYFSLTFAQWSSFLVFGASVYVASKLLKNRKVPETVARTSREAQDLIATTLKDDEKAPEKAVEKAPKFTPKAKAEKKVEPVKAAPAPEPDPEPSEEDLKAEQEAKEAVARARAKAEELAEGSKKKKRRKDDDKKAEDASSDADDKLAAGDAGKTKPKNE